MPIKGLAPTMGVRRSSIYRAFVAVLFTTAAVVVPTVGSPLRAEATVGANDYSYSSASPLKVDPWNFYYRECVSFIAWRMNHDNGVSFANSMKGPNSRAGHWGNAYEWQANAINIGYLYNQAAARGAVAWWNASYHGAGALGHVGYVVQKNTDGSILVEEYNAEASPRDHSYRIRTIKAGSSAWPSGFIHIKDLQSAEHTADIVSYEAGNTSFHVGLSTGGSFSWQAPWLTGIQRPTVFGVGDVNGL